MPSRINEAGKPSPPSWLSQAWLPLLGQLGSYRSDWLRADLAAGLSVAAVALPSAIAYPAIAGLPIETGLFATIFSLIGYALFGPSRQLMIGPDTATCIMLAAVLASSASAGEAERVSFTIALTIVVGVFCFVAGLLRLGFLANFLSRPMLVGFLAGIALSLIVGQIERLTTVDVQSHGLVRPLIELAARIDNVHLMTLIVGLGTLIFLRLARYAASSLPASLIAIILVTLISYYADLRTHGVTVLGPLPEVAFEVHWPPLAQMINLDLLGGALAIMLVGFGSGAVTARSFAMKARSSIDADRELFGFGASNIFSGLFGGFPVTASDSRTAVNFAVGGRTQLAGVIAATTLAVIVLYVAGALAYLPTATLGAILVSAAIDLIDLAELRALLRISWQELCFALITMIGVVVVGVLQGVFVAIAATLLHLLWASSHPRLALLGRIPGSAGLYKLHRYPEAQPIPGLTIVVLQSALVFFNADFVKRRLLKIAHATRANSRWFILDAAAVNTLDSTGILALEEVRAHLVENNVSFAIADLNSRARSVIDRSGMANRTGTSMIFASAESAVAAFEALPKPQ
jgi:high affinity sulfate transporter 1